MPNASIVLIQTRWHQDDLARRLLREMKDGGDRWEVINLPALSEPAAVATGPLSEPPASAGGAMPNRQLTLPEHDDANRLDLPDKHYIEY